MPNYDWVGNTEKSGEQVEGLIANLICLKFEGARRVNPGRGDGGIDVVLEAPDGDIVWQIKKFASAINNGQFGQIKRSWNRFLETYPKGNGCKDYYLVTPWTPTEKRIEEFRALTSATNVHSQWLGRAFVENLSDEFPHVMEHFRRGDDLFQHSTREIAILTQEPLPNTSPHGVRTALEKRVDELQKFTNSTDPHYSFEPLQFVEQAEDAVKNHLSVPGAAYYSITSNDQQHWTGHAVVPAHSDAGTIAPISVAISFSSAQVTPEELKSWQEWGQALPEVEGTINLQGSTIQEANSGLLSMSFQSPLRDLTWSLTCLNPNGEEKFHSPISLELHTQGVGTGWHQCVFKSPSGLLTITTRFNPQMDQLPLVNLSVENLRDFRVVKRESAWLQMVEDGDHWTLNANESPMIRLQTKSFPKDFLHFVHSAASSLVSLSVLVNEPVEKIQLTSVTELELENWKSTIACYQQGFIQFDERVELNLVPGKELEVNQIASILRGDTFVAYTFEPKVSIGGKDFSFIRSFGGVLENLEVHQDDSLQRFSEGQTLRIYGQVINNRLVILE